HRRVRLSRRDRTRAPAAPRGGRHERRRSGSGRRRMLTLATILAGVMVIALTFYALLAGADFGGGVWDLLARGPRAEAQRRLIESAIGPIWEANHVWLIAVIVIL